MTTQERIEAALKVFRTAVCDASRANSIKRFPDLGVTHQAGFVVLRANVSGQLVAVPFALAQDEWTPEFRVHIERRQRDALRPKRAPARKPAARRAPSGYLTRALFSGG